MSKEAAYTLKNTTTLATFDVEVDGDRTFYGRPITIQTKRIDVGTIDTRSYGNTPDQRVLNIILLGGTKGAKFTDIETMFKDDTTKTLVFPDVDVDGSSSATANGDYMFIGLEKRIGANITRLRITLQAFQSEAVT